MIQVGKDFGHLYSNNLAKAGAALTKVRLLRTLSSWVLKTCKDRECRNSLSHCLTVLMVKKIFLISSLNVSCFLSSSYCAAL